MFYSVKISFGDIYKEKGFGNEDVTVHSGLSLVFAVVVVVVVFGVKTCFLLFVFSGVRRGIGLS